MSPIELLIAILAPVLATSTESGRVSVYRPGDGFNHGELACGGRFTSTQVHIAHRRWRKLGCGTPVLIVSHSTGRRALATVQDAGPFGIVEVLPKAVKRKARWRVWTKSLQPPAGWRWRGAVDISWGLWIKLGRPRFLSRVTMYFLPRGLLDQCEDLLRGVWLSRLLRVPLYQFPEVLEHMELRSGLAHQLDSTGADANLLGHSSIVEAQQIYAANEIASHASTVPGLDVPDCSLSHVPSMAETGRKIKPGCRV